ncbi:MAG TPA: gamma-glutamyl-gamma-aminobutyrate hydrolase, partial [Nitrospiraceae bacterium]|nr:gamma-glutamyl-gamma-aminobutyrate hydrolase [Nitrospiraceae bacterium]
MKPIIGITSDIDGDLFKLRQDYVSAVEKCGGLPLILPPTADNIPQIADLIDGLLLPGGNDLSPEYYGEKISVSEDCLKIVGKERSDFEFALIKEAIK